MLRHSSRLRASPLRVASLAHGGTIPNDPGPGFCRNSRSILSGNQYRGSCGGPLDEHIPLALGLFDTATGGRKVNGINLYPDEWAA